MVTGMGSAFSSLFGLMSAASTDKLGAATSAGDSVASFSPASSILSGFSSSAFNRTSCGIVSISPYEWVTGTSAALATTVVSMGTDSSTATLSPATVVTSASAVGVVGDSSMTSLDTVVTRIPSPIIVSVSLMSLFALLLVLLLSVRFASATVAVSIVAVGAGSASGSKRAAYSLASASALASASTLLFSGKGEFVSSLFPTLLLATTLTSAGAVARFPIVSIASLITTGTDS
mmetsp:Transcript_36618/g.63196  ORF Transcript_36618/g.63196 Transcript_36618/m.63196 type:complete len:233 (-) Transcript_36618:358-1056(-)